ncbi:putative alpha-N-acetylglucosaminidase [Xylariales sp. PMI_506]|nr:putative alpha-N-acetylglucosaminidase [Xylariales sp. PMI_506]
MRLLSLASWAVGAAAVATRAINTTSSTASLTAGVEALVQRRIPQHASSFEFAIVNATTDPTYDTYTVSSTSDGKILVQGNTVSALLSGFHSYLSNVVNVDIWWFIGSQLDQAPAELPSLSAPLTGSSVVQYRYHFNTVTTSYTGAFWDWEDWELQLDWMALRGINLPLAWIGVEKILIEVFQDIGFTDAEIEEFLSGPAFLAWNHFGNIQGSWGGKISYDWIDSQFALQLQILQRMLELGMTPILPAFPGFVPPSITRLFPEANVTNGSVWEAFPSEYTSDTFLNPDDALFQQLQISFISKQKEYYGNITTFYTLDQFNENDPASGDASYLQNISYYTWQSLKAADPDAIWVMQGWLFSSNSAFWTNDRIEAFLGGVTVDTDMLILDLFSETSPQWLRTSSYYGKPWIWCELHGYGGNMGLYGQIMNITVNAMAAVDNTSATLVGFGLSMEGQEGNEIMYNLLLDQAWSKTAIDTETYFHDWVSKRYGASSSIPDGLYTAWELVRPTVYNNTNSSVQAVTKSILELVPATSGLINKTGHHSTQICYQQSLLVEAWSAMYQAGLDEPSLFSNPAYEYDLVDWTRQVLANGFQDLYVDFIDTYLASSNSSAATSCTLKTQANKMLALLSSLDSVLSTNENFLLYTWISAARATAVNSSDADFLEYNARNQVTLWGPLGEISDYASKTWSGLVSTYYLPRWRMFTEYILFTAPSAYNATAFDAELLAWEISWGQNVTGGSELVQTPDDLQIVLAKVVSDWTSVFSY